MTVVNKQHNNDTKFEHIYFCVGKVEKSRRQNNVGLNKLELRVNCAALLRLPNEIQ